MIHYVMPSKFLPSSINRKIHKHAACSSMKQWTMKLSECLCRICYATLRWSKITLCMINRCGVLCHHVSLSVAATKPSLGSLLKSTLRTVRSTLWSSWWGFRNNKMNFISTITMRVSKTQSLGRSTRLSLSFKWSSLKGCIKLIMVTWKVVKLTAPDLRAQCVKLPSYLRARSWIQTTTHLDFIRVLFIQIKVLLTPINSW